MLLDIYNGLVSSNNDFVDEFSIRVTSTRMPYTLIPKLLLINQHKYSQERIGAWGSLLYIFFYSPWKQTHGMSNSTGMIN